MQRKGYLSHLLYDKIQFSVHTDWFKDLLKDNNPKMTSEEDWIVRTALKILQDIEDVTQFNIKEHLPSLKYFETPNNEKADDIKRYNQLFIDIYEKAPHVSIEDLGKMWVDWNIPIETAAKMREKSYEIQKNHDLVKRIKEMYGETLRRKDEFFNQYCQ